MFGSKKDDTQRYAHNTYLEFLIGSGILGFLLFLIILMITIRNFLKSRKNFLLQGRQDMVSLVSSYQLSFVSLIIYLLIFSDMYHKYLFVSLALSQVALNLSQGKGIIADENTVLHQ